MSVDELRVRVPRPVAEGVIRVHRSPPLLLRWQLPHQVVHHQSSEPRPQTPSRVRSRVSPADTPPFSDGWAARGRVATTSTADSPLDLATPSGAAGRAGSGPTPG